MQQELTKLLRATPFTQFLIITRDGESQPVSHVERLSVGRNVCAYVDQHGYIALIPYSAIESVVISDQEPKTNLGDATR
jgi:hypothetical protein